MIVYIRGFPGSSAVKDLPAMQETGFDPWVRKMEEGMTTHYSILAWRIPWTEMLGELLFIRSQSVGHK